MSAPQPPVAVRGPRVGADALGGVDGDPDPQPNIVYAANPTVADAAAGQGATEAEAPAAQPPQQATPPPSGDEPAPDGDRIARLVARRAAAREASP